MINTKFTYGWRRDLHDQRDFLFAETFQGQLPLQVDLRQYCSTIYDQGQLGSCTANAVGALYEVVQNKNAQTSYTPSRLFIYWNTRELEGTISYDSGAYIRDTMKVASSSGCPIETLWPYNINKFKQKPPTAAYTAGKKHTIVQYSRVNNTSLTAIQHALALGYPVVVGFTVYESFETQEVAQTGIMPMPGPNEQILGGHAVLVVGYDNSTRRFIIRNSWGAGWGDKGYFYGPYEYFTNPKLSNDFWTATSAK